MATIATETMDVVTVSNPISSLRALWNGATSKEKKEAIDLGLWRHQIQLSVEKLLADRGGCFDLHNAPNGRMKCHCMSKVVLDDFQKFAVVDYLMTFAMMTKTQQESLVIEWMRYAKMTPGATSLCYFLPGSSTQKICKHACAKVLNFGERTWRRVALYLKKNLQPQRGLKGREGNRVLGELEKFQLVTFFEEMMQLGTPRATLLIRNFNCRGNVY